MRRRNKNRHQAPEPMNITAFMNLMVILVPFLLITAVFSRMTILELNIPLAIADQKNPQDQPGLQLEIIIRNNSLEVADRKGGLIKQFEKNATGYDYKALSKLLVQIKQRSPDTQDVTLLSEPEVSYDALVQLMDTVRVVSVVRGFDVVQAELFPNISIGDAPVTATKQNTKGKS